MAAGKKGILQVLKDEVFDVYGKENVIPILCKGAALGLVYILWEISKLEPKPLPIPSGNE